MTSRLRIYIAGSISNFGTLSPPEVDLNLEGFASAETMLRAHGYDPINPARRGKAVGRTWLAYMRDSLRDIADSDGIALLDGWENSRGAQIERELGSDLGIPTFPLDVWLEGARERALQPIASSTGVGLTALEIRDGVAYYVGTDIAPDLSAAGRDQS